MASQRALEPLIEAEARGFDLQPAEEALSRLAAFAALFMKWNEHINLGAVGSPEELVERHFIDAFAAVRFVPLNARVIDVGSGGGLPGLPLALCRADVKIDLFEPTHKKAAFLRTAIRELGLGSRLAVHVTAVESPLPATLDGTFDVAMSRATLEPREWLELGSRLVRPVGGRVLVFATVQGEASLPQPAGAIHYGRSRALLSFEAH